MTWPPLWVTADPTNCIHYKTTKTRIDTRKQMPMHSHWWQIIHIHLCMWIFTNTYKLMCRHTETQNTFDFVIKLEQRRHLRHRQTIHSSQLCTCPHPIWNWVLTSNIDHCWACTKFATMFKDTAWDKQKHANNSPHPESKLTWTHCRSDLAVCFCVLDGLLIESRVAPQKAHYSCYVCCR